MSLAIVAAAGFGLWFASPALAADNKEAVCVGIEATGGSCDGTPATSVNDVVGLIIDIFSWIVGVVSVIMVIFGGFQYVTSAGDSAKAAKGRQTILFALVGLVIVALAQVIVVFVLNSVTTAPTP